MAPERMVVGMEPARHTVEGEGFEVRRAFPTPRVDAVDPFLLLDHVGPRDDAPGKAKGAPDHPHRGFETVTYIIEGEGEHEDSAGNRGVLRAGDVQWMTAGSGVVHSEMPSARIRREGGRSHFLQLWVNLPAAKKMVPPRYQDVPAAEIPAVPLADGLSARVIAGTVAGVTGPVETHSPFLYTHVTTSGVGSARLSVPDDHEVFVYVLTGALAVGSASARVGDGTLVRFTPARTEASGDVTSDVLLAGAGGPGECIVVSGRPLREPVARYGPFVMNTRQELVEAVEDFRAGRMGHIRR